MTWRRIWTVTILWLVLVLLLSLASTAAAGVKPGEPAVPGQPPEAGAQLVQDTGGTAEISTNAATGVASFVRLPEPDKALSLSGVAPEARSLAFFERYGDLFGITQPRAELKLVEEAKDSAGNTHLLYEQVYWGLPVFGSNLRTHFDKSGRLTAVNGVFIPDIAVDPRPALAADEAADIAVAAVLDQLDDAPMRPVTAAESELIIFRAGLVQGVPGPNLLAYQVTVTDGANVREFVFVDAHKGVVVDQYTGVHGGIYRELYEPTLQPANLQWQEGDPFPTGDTDWNNELLGALETYNLFASMTNGSWLSYDSADAVMKTVNDDPAISCPNANWNGVSTNYCTGVTGDDTVAHEWGHAYTDYTHNLIYAWQSGALNESYSDIWGEVVDLLNGRGDDTPGGLRDSNGNFCSTYDNTAFGLKRDDTYRWVSGEDDPAFGGPIRDMWRPECHQDPGRVLSGNYTCSSSDGGGVHTNSGVPNHAFALLVDGGTYNGQTITGIGLTKAAHIYWQAQRFYQGPTTSFPEHADALEAACSDLLGSPLYELVTTGPGTWGNTTPAITQGDCDQLPNVALAVELRTAPNCTFDPMFDPNTPALCSGELSPDSHLAQDFESGLGSWTVSQMPSNPSTWDPRDWQVVTDLPQGRPGSSAYGPDPVVGNCSTDLDNGTISLQSPVIAIPGDASTPVRMAFDHLVSLELGWDGGNLRASVNGGPFNLVPGSAFDFNPYPDTLETAGAGNDNPLAGQAAFTGGDEGDVTSAWGQSQIDLSAIGVDPGDTVQLRWDLGTDGCNGWDGWYVDDVRVYTCEACAAPDQVTGMAVSTVGSNTVRLDWNAAAGATAYEVWRATDDPYFDPTGLDCANPPPYVCAETANTFYEAPDLGDVNDNYTYRVIAASSCGHSAPTAPRGEFDFSLAPGTP